MPNTISLSDVLRRLLVVLGCVVLATTQPMSAFAGTAAGDPQRSPDTVIYPKSAPEKGADTPTLKPESGIGAGPYFLIVVVLLGAGAWLLWNRKGNMVFGARNERKLQIEESKSLGNRQYLVVASYEGKKFLLGVTTERIQLLSNLPDEEGKGK